MTDGERLVWAATYALFFESTGDSVASARAASRAVTALREAAVRRTAGGDFVLCGIEERGFIDEIVNVP